MSELQFKKFMREGNVCKAGNMHVHPCYDSSYTFSSNHGIHCRCCGCTVTFDNRIRHLTTKLHREKKIAWDKGNEMTQTSVAQMLGPEAISDKECTFRFDLTHAAIKAGIPISNIVKLEVSVLG